MTFVYTCRDLRPYPPPFFLQRLSDGREGQGKGERNGQAISP